MLSLPIFLLILALVIAGVWYAIRHEPSSPAAAAGGGRLRAFREGLSRRRKSWSRAASPVEKPPEAEPEAACPISSPAHNKAGGS